MTVILAKTHDCPILAGMRHWRTGDYVLWAVVGVVVALIAHSFASRLSTLVLGL